jgi:hypothetical protein
MPELEISWPSEKREEVRDEEKEQEEEPDKEKEKEPAEEKEPQEEEEKEPQEKEEKEGARRGCGGAALYLKSDLCIPRNETAWPRSHFLYSCTCERLIFPGSVC